MSLLKINTFLKYFIYHPDSTHLSPEEQKTVQTAQKVISVLTLTMLPRLCKFIWGDKVIWDQKEKSIIFSRLRESIRTTNELDELSEAESSKIKRVPCHKIVHNLFLGRGTAFNEAACLTEYTVDNAFKVVPLIGTNIEKFQTVVSLCSLSTIQQTSTFDMDEPLQEETIESSFKKRNVQWLYCGRLAEDKAEGWLPIVHDCTLVQSEDAKVAVYDTATFQTLQERKSEAIIQLQPTKWFAPVFNAIDEAILKEKRVLVHCQAGVSRSPTIVMAYLINRCNVTAADANLFVKSKRPCVASKFLEQLGTYAESLRVDEG